jgi:hypothetical protein
MLVKSQHYLQPTVSDAHSVIVEDNFGNIIYVAVEADGGNIVTAQAGEPEFEPLIKALGIDKMTIVRTFNPKSVEEMKGLL